MQAIRNLLTAALLLIIIFGYGIARQSNDTISIEGLVVSDITGKPVGSAHVYVVHGEEEALSNTKGEFRIETSKKIPLTLYAEHEGYEKFQVIVQASDQKQVVKLKSK